MTLPWIIAAAAAGLLAGPRIRASVFARSTEDGRPRRACPECSGQVLVGRWLWCSVLPVTGRCPHCKARIGPDALAAEAAAGLVLAVAAARASSGWELAALARLALLAVPLAFIDTAVQRLPDLLTISAFTGTLVLLAVAEGTAHQPWLLVRAVIGAASLAGFYLALWLVFPDQLGLGDVKLAASIGLILAWGSWSELFLGALAGRSWAPSTRRCSRPGAGRASGSTCRSARSSCSAPSRSSRCYHRCRFPLLMSLSYF